MAVSLSRRAFLGTSVASLAAAGVLHAETPAETLLRNLVDEPAFQPSTLFLTWQRDPTTTMTVQWVGTRGETADTKVYYSSGASFVWSAQETVAKPYAQTDFKVFRAELTGLMPGTDYVFKIGNHSPIYRFRTMPAKATDTIQFISGGDCGVNVHTIANNIQAARQDPHFAVIGGDLAYENGMSADVHLAFLRNYSKHMVGHDGRMIPLVPCIGNHEVDGFYEKPRTKAPFFYSLFDGLFEHTSFASLDFGDYLSLILLDTGHTSPIAGEQADWLEKTLKTRVDHPHVMAVNHVPAYPSFRNPDPTESKDHKTATLGTGEGNRQHWVPLFEKYRVPVVLEHHDHTFKRTKPLLGGLANDNGVIYLGDGSWGRLRSPKSPDQLHYLAKSSRDFHLSLHRLEGQERFHIALDENGKIMDTCCSAQRKLGQVAVQASLQ
ncbi:MAG TPA: metallophosphoesterase family protein [Pirellulales bacterium]|jgi:hypothetical protein|nr:metallophosphoesterase family protein [Pirellulales bacterium]